MAVETLPRILGPNTRIKITTAAGALTLALFTKIAIEEAPTNKEANVAGSKDDLKVFLKGKCKVTCTNLRGLALCYSDLPPVREKVTKIEFETLDDDGEVIEDAEDFPDLIRSDDNPDGYINWAVSEKRGNQDEGAGDVEIVLESGYLNAKVSGAPATPSP